MKKVYLHGIEKNNGIAFHNLGVTGGVLLSPENIDAAPIGYMTTFTMGNIVAYIIKAIDTTLKNYTSIKCLPISELKINPSLIRNFIGRRATWYVWAGAILRNGGMIGIGVPPYERRFPLEDERKRIMRVSDLELEFEELRRRIDPSLPSRLTCLYLADNDEGGHQAIRSSIKGEYEEFKVHIVDSKAIFRADMRWIDMYQQEPKKEFIDNYWIGKPSSEKAEECLWEYLLEGSAELINKDNLKSIQALGGYILNAKKR